VAADAATLQRDPATRKDAPTARLEMRDATRRFDDFVVVDDVGLSVNAGGFFTLLRPSGCGKTTLLRMIAGFDLPDAGAIVLDGVDLRDAPLEQRPIPTVFQSCAPFPHMTVPQDIAFPPKMTGKAESEIHAMARDRRHVGVSRSRSPRPSCGRTTSP